MKLSTSTCIYFNRPDGTKKDIRDTIRACSVAGYRVLDMNFHDAAVFDTPFRTDEWESWVYSLRDVALDCGVTFSQGHAHFYNYTESGQNNEYLQRLVERSIMGAEILGIPWLVIHAATDFKSAFSLQSSRKKGIDYFRSLSDFASKHNTGLAIENLWELNISPMRRYTSNVEELADLVEAIDRSNIGICWDTEHSSIMNQDIKSAFAIIGDKLRCTHISDYVSISYDHVLPYCGISDWDSIYDAFASIDYKGDFTYEAHRSTMYLPESMVPSLLKYSVELGEKMIGEIERRKEELKNE